MRKRRAGSSLAESGSKPDLQAAQLDGGESRSQHTSYARFMTIPAEPIGSIRSRIELIEAIKSGAIARAKESIEIFT